MPKLLLYLVFGITAIPQLLYGQLQIQQNIPLENIAQTLSFSNSIVPINVSFAGDTRGIGYFTSTNTNLGLSSGVIISTGDCQIAKGPNNDGDATQPIGGFNTSGDSILTAICGQNTFDAAVLKFDFTATGDSIEFSFVFASEEYVEYVDHVNDIFAILISGPGYQELTNIALVPDTNLPISVRTINNINNANYFINNGDGFTSTGTIQFDGFTTVLKAKAILFTDSVYNIRFAIADAGDGIADAAVFISANTLLMSANNEETIPKFTLYPNPAKDFAMLNYTMQSKGVVQVIDALGRVVYSAALQGNAGTVQMPTSNLAGGLYHVRVLNDFNNVWNGKLVVE